MNDERTEEEIYNYWIKVVNKTHSKGWKHIISFSNSQNRWIFKSPSGSIHDLSSANLDLLDEIEKNKWCLAKEFN